MSDKEGPYAAALADAHRCELQRVAEARQAKRAEQWGDRLGEVDDAISEETWPLRQRITALETFLRSEGYAGYCIFDE